MSVKTPKDDWIPLPPLLDNAKEAGFEELHRRLAERGFADIRHAHGCVFRWVEPDGTRLTELAELAGHSKQAVGEFVCDLEAMGYVERVPDPLDGRAKIIRLTERGAEAKAPPARSSPRSRPSGRSGSAASGSRPCATRWRRSMSSSALRPSLPSSP